MIFRALTLSLGLATFSIASAMSATPQPAPAAPAVQAPAPIFVLNSLDGNVSVIDPVTWTETKRIPTGKEPHHLYLTPDEKSVIVANALSDSLTFIDPRTAEVQRVVSGILDPYQLRFSPDMKWFVTVANRLNHIDIYKWDGQTPTLVKRISSSKTPSHLWIDSKSTTVWATMQDSNELVAVDLATQAIKWRVKTGTMPADVFGTPDDKHLLIGLTGGDGVEVYDVSNGPAQKIKKSPQARARMHSVPLVTNNTCWSATEWPTPSAKLITKTSPWWTNTPVQPVLIAWTSRPTAKPFCWLHVGRKN